MLTVKREHLVIGALAALVLGYVAGRVGAKRGDDEPLQARPAPPRAPAPDAAAPPTPHAAPAPTVAPAPAPPPAVATITPSEAAPRPAPPVARPASPASAPRATPPSAPRATPPPPASKAAASSGAQQGNVWRVAVDDDDASRGPKDAPVTVVLFTAFGCQPCLDFQPAMEQLVEQYGDKVRVVFKHKAIEAPHPDALLAATAAEAARQQGKFWEYSARVFEAGFAIGRENLEQYAQALGLNMNKFRRAMDSDEARAAVLKDSLQAYEVAAHSFPNALANGVRMGKPKGWDSLKKVVDEELVRAQAELKAGTPKDKLYDSLTRNGRFFPQLGPPVGSIDTAGSAALGGEGAKIELVAFEDFQCPFCAQHSPNLKSFQKTFGEEVRFAFKHFPLEIHADAQLASEAAVEAQRQGKFWEYHDLLFQNQKALKREDLERYAEQLGLDMPAFREALDQQAHRSVVSKDFADGQRARVGGTPTVFLNNRKYQGPRGYNPLGLEAVSRSYLGFRAR